jgi:hypothetical protein
MHIERKATEDGGDVLLLTANDLVNYEGLAKKLRGLKFEVVFVPQMRYSFTTTKLFSEIEFTMAVGRVQRSKIVYY